MLLYRSIVYKCLMNRSTDAAASRVRVGGRALRLVAPRRVELVALPVPEPRDDEVVVRVRAVGVCGTDLHAFRGRSGRLPVVLGHDVAGTVADAGRGVAGLRPGARVTIDPTLSCQACAYCRLGRPQLCASGGYLGMTVDGAMADYICLPAANAIDLPREVADHESTLLEPLVVALHLLDRVHSLGTEGAAGIVVGGGPLGIAVAQVLERHGHPCTVIEPVAARREAAAALGLVARAPEAVPAPSVEPRLLVETSATEAGFALSAELATPGSAIAVIGRAPATVPVSDVLMGELAVVGVRGGPGRYPEAVGMVARGEVTLAPLVTHTVELADAGRLLDLAAQPDTPVLRAVIECEG